MSPVSLSHHSSQSNWEYSRCCPVTPLGDPPYFQGRHDAVTSGNAVLHFLVHFRRLSLPRTTLPVPATLHLCLLLRRLCLLSLSCSQLLSILLNLQIPIKPTLLLPPNPGL